MQTQLTLKDGDSATETYTIYVTDTAGLQDSATLTVNITGANNEPTITVTNSDLSTLSIWVLGNLSAP